MAKTIAIVIIIIARKNNKNCSQRLFLKKKITYIDAKLEKIRTVQFSCSWHILFCSRVKQKIWKQHVYICIQYVISSLRRILK